MWASVGIRPSVVLGHSLGEIAAAQSAGVFFPRRGAAICLYPRAADGGLASGWGDVSRFCSGVAGGGNGSGME